MSIEDTPVHLAAAHSSPFVAPGLTNMSDRIKHLEGEIQTLKTERDADKSEIEALKFERKADNNKFTVLAAKIEAVDKEIQALKDKIKALETKRAKVNRATDHDFTAYQGN